MADYSYTLKANGMRHSLDEDTLTEGRSIIYTYDNLNRLTQEDADSINGGYTSTYEYDLAGNRTRREVNVNGQTLTTDYVYDPNTDRLLKETHTGPVYSFVQGNEQYYAYATGGKLLYYRDLHGNKIGAVNAFLTGLPSVWNRYVFILAMALVPILLFGPAAVSVIRRLTLYHGRPTRLRPAVPRKGICLLVAFVMLFGPESFHNLANAQVEYANLNTATWANGDTTIEYTYDANGSVETKTTKITSTQAIEETVVNSYNLANRLETVTTTRGDTVEIVEYTYNDDGIRVKSEFIRAVSDVTDQTKITTYLVDPYNHTGYPQTLEEETITTDYISGEPQTPVTETTTYLIGDDVIAQTKEGNTQYLLYDGHGSTRQLAEYDTDVTIADSYSYDGYGVLLQDGSVAQNNPGKVAQQQTNLLYAGEHFDVNSQSYYLRARYYNPLTGLFNRMDPYAGSPQDPQSLHKYRYCHANPVNSVDPSGKWQICDIAITVGIIGMIVGMSLPADTIGDRIKNGIIIGLFAALIADLILVGICASIFALSMFFTIPFLGGESLLTISMIAAGGTTFAVVDGSIYFRQLARLSNLWPWGKIPAPDQPVKVFVSESNYPEYAQKIKRVNGDGKPFTLDRSGAIERRKASLSGTSMKPGLDRDEWPPALALEGGSATNTTYMDPSQNRGVGASIGNQLRKYEDGTKFTIEITE